MGAQVTYADNLPEIPSEFIEPYALRFMMMQLESLAHGLITPKEVREYLKGAEYFITSFSGVHARIATSNEYYKLMNTEDNAMLEIAKNVFKVN